MNTKVCLSFTAHHAELWQPAWGIRLILEALISFFPTPSDGAIGALNWTTEERKRLARKSTEFCCPRCGPIISQLSKMEDFKGDGDLKCSFTDEIAKLHMLQKIHHKQDDEDEDDVDGQSDGVTQSEEVTQNEDVNNGEVETTTISKEGGDKKNSDLDSSTSTAQKDSEPDEKVESNDSEKDDTREESSNEEHGNGEVLNVEIFDIPSTFESYIPTWLTDPVLDVMLLLSVVVVILLIRKVQDLTTELNSL